MNKKTISQKFETPQVMTGKTFGLSEALVSLALGSEWTLFGDDYSGLNWSDEERDKPTEEECTAEIARLQAEYDTLEYQRLRVLEYPPITDYLDGIVKGDQEQVDTYIAACLAVKTKYPKPA
jgi:hypothetical protein